MNSPFSNAISDIERLQLEREVNEAKQKLKTIQEERDMAVYQRDQVRYLFAFLFFLIVFSLSPPLLPLQALAKLTELQMAVSANPALGLKNEPSPSEKSDSGELDVMPRERLAQLHSRLCEDVKKIEEVNMVTTRRHN